MSQIQPLESQLMKLRSSIVPQDYHQVVHRIFDKKLRSFLSLNSKQEVLEHCQQLLITKTVDYMNCISQLQKSQLKSLNSLNIVLTNKQCTIQSLNKRIDQLLKQKNSQQLIINNLRKQLQFTKSQWKCQQIKSVEQLNNYIKIIQCHDQDLGKIKSEYILVKSNLEALNKSLSFDLGLKTTGLKKMKQEFEQLKEINDKSNREFNTKIKQARKQFDVAKQALLKDKQNLQQLLDIKDKQINNMKDGKNKKTEKGTEDRKSRLATSRSRSKTKNFEIQTQNKNELIPFINNAEKLQKQLANERIQAMTKTKILINSESQTIVQQIFENNQLTQSQIKYRQYTQHKYQLICNEKIKTLSSQLKEDLLLVLHAAQKQMNNLKLLTDQRVNIMELKIQEIELAYESRPSREQDLEHIQKLKEQNKSLMVLCSQANRHADTAFIALQQYHVQLQNYKKVVPMSISGNSPPKMVSYHGYKRILSSKQSIKNKMNTTASLKLERKNDDSDTFTQQILKTQHDAQTISYPTRGSYKRPLTTGGHPKRRRSII